MLEKINFIERITAWFILLLEAFSCYERARGAIAPFSDVPIYYSVSNQIPTLYYSWLYLYISIPAKNSQKRHILHILCTKLSYRSSFFIRQSVIIPWVFERLRLFFEFVYLNYSLPFIQFLADQTISISGHTIESAHAIFLPLGASFGLLLMFFFFDSLQLLFTLMTAGKINNIFVFIYLYIYFVICMFDYVKSYNWI